MVKITEGAVDVFEGDGLVEFDKGQRKHYSKRLLALIRDCMKHNPSERLTFPKVLEDIRKRGVKQQQAGLRDKPEDSEDWDPYLLLDTIMYTVCIGEFPMQNLENILTYCRDSPWTWKPMAKSISALQAKSAARLVRSCLIVTLPRLLRNLRSHQLDRRIRKVQKSGRR
jgi:hypothetical protein